MADTIKSFPLDFKAVGDDGAFEGLLSTYGNEDLVGDVCDEGCWDASVSAKGRFPLLWQHDQGEPIGSFEVVDTSKALRIAGRFNLAVRRGAEAYALLKARDVTGLSVGFNLLSWDYQDGVRHIKEADLWEGSFVTFPANPLAFAEAKSMSKRATLRKSVSQLEDFKSLSEAVQDKVLRAIDEALEDIEPEDEEEQKDATEDEPSEDEEDEVAKEAPEEAPEDEEDEDELKAALAHIRTTLSSIRNLFDDDTEEESA